MPRQSSKKGVQSRCTHSKLAFSESSHAKEARFVRATIEQRMAATTPTGTLKSTSKSRASIVEPPPSTFPAPLVLPDDELSWDPTYEPQSLRSWTRQKERNKVTPSRRTLYLAPPPEVDQSVEFVQRWTSPRQKGGQKIKHPKMNDVKEYLEAFYRPLPVKLLPPTFMRFTEDFDDVEDIENETNRKIVGVKTQSSGCKGIRTRPTPKGEYTHQLNLNDLLDAAIWSLPENAYALLMLVEHDIYEDEEDDFACGRAYGGSRIAVVSMARYHPILDEIQGVEREHAWPASHCDAYLKECCGEVEHPAKKKNTKSKKKPEIIVIDDSDSDIEMIESISPMQAAVTAHNSLPSFDETSSPAILTGLWLGRVCRTASHELGHCFGIDHCVYYACSMQGTASIIEDSRQPPFLCPVDLAKVLKATDADMKGRYQALLVFCEKHKEVHLFSAYRAWVHARLEQLNV